MLEMRNEWDLADGLKMTLDGVEQRFHVRERDNRIAIVITQPGWAAHTNYDYWYVSIEDLRSTGIVDEGQDVKRWKHRTGSTYPGGVSKSKAMTVAKEWYMREAKNK